RLTTLQLLLDAIHSEIAQAGAAMPAARLEPLVANAEPFRRQPADRFKVWPTNRDRDAFNEVMAAPHPVEYDKLVHRASRMAKAHRFFAQRCRDWLAGEGDHSVDAR